jgi:predicted metal-dependent peptidase
LREFFASKERVKEQIDSIDPMLYHYGMELYGDVPIIEPIEISDLPSIHAIVIAVDTSGSCGGCVAERFLKETNNLLRDIRFMGGVEKLYLIQCDAAIQQEDVYEGDVELEQFSDFEEKLWMGWGGTSFVPVFKRIRELQNQGETIDCLIYLSDGNGRFPKQAPDCPTFFVMPEECCPQDKDSQGGYSWIPDWVNVVKLEGRIY